MGKRVLTLFMAFVFMALLLPQATIVDASVNSVVFLNSDSGVAINEIGTAQNVKAKVQFTVPGKCSLDVITACYDEAGRMLEALLVEPLSFEAEDANEAYQHETAVLSVTGAQRVKIFVWEETSYYPILKNNGILVKEFDAENYSDKIDVSYGATQDDAYVVVTGKTISVGEIFAALSETQINSKYFEVSAEALGDSTVNTTFVPDTSDWSKGTLTFSGTGIVKLTAQDYDFCVPVDAYVDVVEPVERYYTKLPNTDDYLYRVGNKNTVSLSSLFAAKEEVLPSASNMEVTITGDAHTGTAKGVFTPNASDWTKGTIQFSGVGVAEVTIKDDNSKEYSLLVEVVDGTNATTYSEMSSGNIVMLNDIIMTANQRLYLTNRVLYGNGFTFDVTQGTVAAAGYSTSNGLVILTNGTIDNAKIVGPVYTSYGATSDDDYNNATVLTLGNSTIVNSYISNAASAVRMIGDSLTIVDSTLKGGNFANLDIRDGSVTLEDVTTINQSDSNDVDVAGNMVVGLGIVVYFEQVLDTTTIDIVGSLTQYNELSKTTDRSYIRHSVGKTLFDSLFKNNNLVYTVGENEYLNTGIISMISTVTNDNITDVSGYGHNETISYNGETGYMHAPTSSLGAAPTYETKEQGVIAPEYTFDFATKNCVEKTEGSNLACYYSYGTVIITFDEGDSFEWDTDILSVSKFGEDLSYTVTMNGIDYTGKKITFTETGDYTVTYTYTDSKNYCLDEDKNVVPFDEVYEKNVNISVTAVKPDAKHAEFAFGSSGVASKTVTIGNETYVMPDVSATSDTIGSKTVNGTTVYCPIVDAYTSNGNTTQYSGAKWYMYFPVFKNAVTITDYQDAGLGDAVTYNASTTALPSGLSVPDGPSTVFEYATAGSAPATPTVVDGVLCYSSPEMEGVNRDAMTIYAKYEYKDNAGNIYYYYVAYKCAKITNIACVSGDTLVTLADGSYKRIDEVTHSDKLLVWDFYNGKYTEASPMIISNHGYDYNTVIKLTFDDSTEIKVVNLHQFFDAEENKLVTIDAQTVGDYLNHNFVKRDGNGYKTVKLINYEISKEYIDSYGIVSAFHYDILVEDMFSADYPHELYDLMTYFEVGENLVYDKEKMEADIKTYGLYTYEEFADYMTYQQFDAMNIKYMKISVGKGHYTFDGILDLIEEYLK